MDQAPPPFLESEPPAPRATRYGWPLHLALLTAYPLVLGAAGFLSDRSAGGPAIPTAPLSLVWMMTVELATFGFIFGLAWLASRASPAQLFLHWKGGWRPVWRGFLYSIGLRLLMALIFLLAGFSAVVLFGASEDVMRRLQPDTEQLVDARALVEDPMYLFLNLTVVSFVVAGLREELWRAGVLAGLFALFPRQFDRPKGRLVAVALAALVFGLGHIIQGWGGVAMTTLLGIGLGLIIVFHRSIWEAAIAHGFFDASSFAFLYLLARFRPDLLPGAS